MPTDELRYGLENFIRYRKEHLTGDEKGEAQLFLENLFKAFGHAGLRQAGATLEMRVSRRDNGGTAYADLVWKPRVLVEMKKAGRDLRQDYRQAFEYWINLVPDRPKYVVLCNFDEFWVYDLDRQLEEPVDRIAIDDLPRRWEALAFMLPHEEEPTFGNDLVAVTRETAATVSTIFNRLVERGVDRNVAQRFILQAVMAMFSEDIGLLPRHSFSKAIEEVLDGAGSAYDLLFGLFREMNVPGTTPGGRFEGTPYFNGGLYARVDPFDLTTEEITALGLAAKENWAEVRPVIFGTLFEQSLDQPERHAYGAYFTSEADIQKVVFPSIVRPWRERIEQAETLEDLGKVEADLLSYRVLDPACGSGNFLYVAYRELRRLERQLDEKRQAMSRRTGRKEEMRLAFVSTKQFFGIDLRPFAVEVAKVTLMLARKLAADELGDERTYLPLDDLDTNFQTDNAILVDWPSFDVCIGNPPYLGARNIQEEKSPEEIAAIRSAYPEIGGLSDYVSYWFRKTHDRMTEGGRAGLVGTANIRFGDTRASTLDYIVDNGGTITEAIAHQPWSGDASVEVAIVNWTKGDHDGPKTLWLSRGAVKLEVSEITGSLSPNTDLRAAKKLKINRQPKVCFQGQTPQHTPGFVISPECAYEMVAQDARNAAFIHPYLTGNDLNLNGQPSRFVIDIDADDLVAAEQNAPSLVAYLRDAVLPDRKEAADKEADRNKERLKANPKARLNWHDRNFRERWWQLGYRRPDMISTLNGLDRYIALSRVAVESRQSPYVFVSSEIQPADALQVFAFDDEYSFGILHSTYHRTYFEERCSKMRVDLRYTSKTVFDTFPWPQAPTEETANEVAETAAALVDYQHEKVAEGMTIDKLYASLRDPGRNALRTLQEDLDRAVASVYGLAEEEDTLSQLLALNLSIADEEAAGLTQPRPPGNEGLPGTRKTDHRIEPVEQMAGS
jgi:SAM-dependent methyltransferase